MQRIPLIPALPIPQFVSSLFRASALFLVLRSLRLPVSHLSSLSLSLPNNVLFYSTLFIHFSTVCAFNCSNAFIKTHNAPIWRPAAYPYAGQFAQNLSVQQTIGTPPNLLSTCNAAAAQSAHLHSGQTASSTGSGNSNQHSPTLSTSIYNLSGTPSSSTTPNSLIGQSVINKCNSGAGTRTVLFEWEAFLIRARLI